MNRLSKAYQLRNYKEAAPAKDWKRQPSPNQIKIKARDARVKKALMEESAQRNSGTPMCFFAEHGWPGCPDWVPEGRQALEHMHIYGKRTHKGFDVRFDKAYSVLGCWWHHDQHENEDITILCERDGDEVYRTFEQGDRFTEDYQASEVIE